MKKISLIISLGLNILLGGYTIYKQIVRDALQSQITTKEVAILLPITHPSLENIKQGFIDTVEKVADHKYNFTVYNANGNRMLMLSQAEEVLARGYDLIIPIATAPAQMIKEISIRKGIATPIVFIAAEITPSEYITGVKDDVPIDQQINVLELFKPDLKKLLLVYNSSETRLEQYKKELEKILDNKGIKLETVEIYQSNEIYRKVEPFLSNAIDAVLVFKDNTVVSGIDSLIKLCDKYNVTLMASDLDSVDKGAVLGFGIQEYDLGVLGGKKGLAILEEHKKPSSLEVDMLDEFKVKINSKNVKSQGLNVDQKTIYLMRLGEVV